MKKIWVHKANSFEAAEKYDRRYYLKMSPQKRLETVQFLREIYIKLHPKLKHESRKGLRRVIRITQQK